MKDKICLVTGGTAGIGKATAAGLAKAGAKVVLLARNAEKAKTVANEIGAQTGNTPDVLLADFASLAEVRRGAQEFLANYPKLDVLVNNAGITGWKYEKSQDGFELTFAVNHLAPFLLTNLLSPALEAADRARVVNVSSGFHVLSNLDFENLADYGSVGLYSPFIAYAHSKLANVLFTNELAARTKNTGITVNSLAPGMIATEITRQAPWLIQKTFSVFGQTPEKGAETTLYLALSPHVENVTGRYFQNKKIGFTSPAARNVENARKLWEISMGLCKILETEAHF